MQQCSSPSRQHTVGVRGTVNYMPPEELDDEPEGMEFDEDHGESLELLDDDDDDTSMVLTMLRNLL